MSYSGVQPQYGTFPSDLFTGNGSNTVFTMSSVPGNDAALLVTVDGVRQHTDTYSFSANTLTFSEAPGSGAIIETVNMGSRADIIITEGVYKKTQFTATAAQTNFTIATGYTVGFVDVYLNGIRLVVADDFTANDGSTIILATAAASGDSVEVVAYGTFNVANALLKSGDTMSGNLVVSGTSTLLSPVAIANNSGNTFVIANTGAVTITGTANVSSDTYVGGSLGVGTTTLSYNSGGGVSIYNATAARLKLGDSTSGISSGDGLEIVYDDAAYVWNRENTSLYFGTNGTERLTIDSSGRVTLPYQPAFQVRLSGSQSLAAQNTRYKIAFDTVDYQNGSNYDTTNYRFTAPVTGWYSFSYSVYAYTVQSHEITLWKNGSIYLRNAGVKVPSDVNGVTTSGTWVTKLTASDYVELYTLIQASSLPQQLYHSSERPTTWSGYLIG